MMTRRLAGWFSRDISVIKAYVEPMSYERNLDMPVDRRAMRLAIFITVAFIAGALYAQPGARGPVRAQPEKDLIGHGGGGIFYVAGSTSTHQDIGLDKDISFKVLGIVQNHRKEVHDAFDTRRKLDAKLEVLKELPQETREKLSKEVLDNYENSRKEINEKFIPQLKEILSAEQFERLRQITWQIYGVQALAIDPELAKAIHLNKEQIEAISAASLECDQQMNELYNGRRENFSRRFAFETKRFEIEINRDSKINELLTTNQKEKFSELQGQPFDGSLLESRRPLPRLEHSEGGRDGIFSTVGNPAVQTELGLSQDVIANVQAITEQFHSAWREAGGGFRLRTIAKTGGGFHDFQEAALPPHGFRGGLQGTSDEERNESMAKMMELWTMTTAAFLPLLKGTLSADQYSRLQQINWQAMGTAAFLDAEAIKALEITKEQQSKIISLLREFRDKSAELMSERGGGVDRGGGGGGTEDVRRKTNDLLKIRDAKINGSLTKVQLFRFEILKGKEFEVMQLLDANVGPRPGRSR